MEKIVSFIKGRDDFGKKQIRGDTWEYEHHNPRLVPGDIVLYFYPNGNCLNIYTVDKELEYYYKDGFSYCRGEMTRVTESAQDFVNRVGQTSKVQSKNLVKIIDETVLKYFDLNKTF